MAPRRPDGFGSKATWGRSASGPPSLRAAVTRARYGTRMGPELAGLSPAQYRAVTTDGAPLCVIAGAGAGKTRVLTHRIAHLIDIDRADAAHVLTLTFTRKAAAELRARLGGLGVEGPLAAGTFHGVALAQLRQRWADRRQRVPAIISDPVRLVTPLLGSSSDGPAGRARASAVTREISWAKARLVGPDHYAGAASEAGRRPPLALAAVAELFARYEVDKRRRGVLDLDDLVSACADALAADDSFREAQRWRWRHFFVDEYQDLNPAAERLLRGWLGDRLDLCVVGDPRQAIYGWNGADPSLLADFTRTYPSATVVELDDNFRSTPEIVAVATRVLSSVQPPAAAVDPVALREHGPLPTVTGFPTAELEAKAIARAARDRHPPGAAWSDMAVLARTNARLNILAAAFDDAGIPCRVRGGRPLGRMPVVRSLLEHSVGTGATARSLRTDGRLELSTEGDRDRASAVQGLLDALDQYLDLDAEGTAAAFNAWLAAGDQTHEGAEGDAVVLSSFHRAKGLEWPVVFVAGLEDGLVPLVRAGRPAPIAEERRLLHVALTRAQVELRCSWAAQHRLGERTTPTARSPFLDDVELALATPRPPEVAKDAGARLRLIREQLVAKTPT